MTYDPTTLRECAYRARLAIRSGDAAKYLRRPANNRKGLPLDVVRIFVRVLPDLLQKHCIAEAERLACEIVNKELTHDQGK